MGPTVLNSQTIPSASARPPYAPRGAKNRYVRGIVIASERAGTITIFRTSGMKRSIKRYTGNHIKHCAGGDLSLRAAARAAGFVAQQSLYLDKNIAHHWPDNDLMLSVLDLRSEDPINSFDSLEIRFGVIGQVEDTSVIYSGLFSR